MDEEEFREKVLLLQAIICVLSVVCSFIIIFFYLYLNQLKQSFTFMVIFNIALTDFFLWGVRLLESIYGIIKGKSFEGWFCEFIGYLQIAFALSNFCWISVMSYCIYTSIIHHKGDFSRMRKKFYIFTYLMPFLLSLLPFSTENYGPTDNDVKCWITGDFAGSLHRLLMFYLPLIMVLTYSFWTVRKVWGALRVTDEDVNRRREISRIKNQFLYYPMVVAFCYFIPLLHRVMDFIDPSLGKTKTMMILHYMSAPLQGFFNALVYGTSNRDVKQKLKNILCCYFLKRPRRDTDTMTISLFNGDENNEKNHGINKELSSETETLAQPFITG